jgi:type III pantothenate kinase
MMLLIDLGNTRLKWATLAGARMRPGGVFAHAGHALDARLRGEWNDLARPARVLVASVLDDERERQLEAYLRERFGVAAEFVRSPAATLGVRNAYAEPARLGVDRFLALAALHAREAQAQLLASVGTAMTLDLLDAAGRHHGGLILPAPQLMRASLRAGTARLDVAEGRWREVPDNTADAVTSGALYAAAGAVERFTGVAAERLGVPPVLFLTGGGADELAALLPGARRVHDLVLDGLALWAAAAPAHR